MVGSLDRFNIFTKFCYGAIYAQYLVDARKCLLPTIFMIISFPATFRCEMLFNTISSLKIGKNVFFLWLRT